LNLWVAGLVTAGATTAAIVTMFLVRRRAPAGGFFTDSDRAAGVFGVIGTSFAVLLGFVIFLALTSYSNAKEAAGQEAVAVMELFNTAEFFSPAVRDDLQGELTCYARAVVVDEWPAMRHQHQSARVGHWTFELETSIRQVDITDEKQSHAYDHWFGQDALRQEGRRDRLAEAAPFVPSPLWLILILGAALVVTYMLFYADSAEAFRVQALMIGAVTAIVVFSLLVIRYLDHPYENASGSIKPVAMTRTLDHLEQAWKLADRRVRLPCDGRGAPLTR
jgi:hypothetical protein